MAVATLREARRLAAGPNPVGIDLDIAAVAPSVAYVPGPVAGLAEIHVWTDAGRVVRPLLTVGADCDDDCGGRPWGAAVLAALGGAAKKSEFDAGAFARLVAAGNVEMIDAAEEASLCVAAQPSDVVRGSTRHTHVQPMPAAIMGVAVQMNPYTGHNQAPRVMTGSTHAKQAMGMRGPCSASAPTSAPPRTWAGAGAGAGAPPRGQTEAQRRAQMQERSFASRKNALLYGQRPLVGTWLSTSTGLDERGGGANCIAAVISYDGYNQEDSISMSKGSADRGMLLSDVYKMLEPALDGGAARPSRLPPPLLEGDKLASRHGQKGVIGRIVPQEDMPFTSSGMPIDILINPHAFPTRMTAGQPIESAAAKAAALTGVRVVDEQLLDGRDAFGEITRTLRAHGYHELGSEALIDGRTGEMLKTLVLVGPVFYQRLPHLVRNKAQARGEAGRVDPMIGAPLGGKVNEGGGKVGEMEMWALTGHGATGFHGDRLRQSDLRLVPVDEGRLGIAVGRGNMEARDAVGADARVTQTSVSGALPVLSNILHAVGMSIEVVPK